MYGMHLHYVWLSLEIMCTGFIVIFLENIKLFYILQVIFTIHFEILADSNLCKCLKELNVRKVEWRHSRFFYLNFNNNKEFAEILNENQ